MKKMLTKQLHSFSCAIKGVFSVLKTESHMRFHLVVAIYVIFFCAKFYNLGSAQWAVLMLTMLSVMVAEIFNTALERLCDTVTMEYSKNIKFIKDICAGAVLLSAICAVVVAFILLFRVDVFRYILLYYSHHIFALIMLILCTALAVAFVVVKPEKYTGYIKSIKDEIKQNTQKD